MECRGGRICLRVRVRHCACVRAAWGRVLHGEYARPTPAAGDWRVLVEFVPGVCPCHGRHRHAHHDVAVARVHAALPRSEQEGLVDRLDEVNRQVVLALQNGDVGTRKSGCRGIVAATKWRRRGCKVQPFSG